MDEQPTPTESDIRIMLQIVIHNGFMVEDFKSSPWMYAPIDRAIKGGFVERVTLTHATYQIPLQYRGVRLTERGQNAMDAYLEESRKHIFICYNHDDD